MRARLARIFTGALIGSVSLLVTVFLVGLVYLYPAVAHAPIAPNLREGFIYPFNNHGVIHYLRWPAHVVDVITQYVMIVCVPFTLFGLVLAKAHQEGKDRHLPAEETEPE
ncbi:MAG TPA: hypothetical protein VHZ29_01755 [Rhizomicrobium sp.]|jgi:hypothetical protein|nr:hypothetical protein [Rhizomicrobium sp.]